MNADKSAFSLEDLYLAYRQAKNEFFLEKRAVGTTEFASFEEELPNRLEAMRKRVSRASWFEGIKVGSVWLMPKRVLAIQERPEIVRVGSRPRLGSDGVQVQLRLAPNPEFSILEILYLWEFGPFMDQLLSRNAIGYRLQLRKGAIDKNRRCVFEFWPSRYEEFRQQPIKVAKDCLQQNEDGVAIVSADVAAFYDSVDPGFLISEDFKKKLSSVELPAAGRKRIDIHAYERATKSLLRSYGRFRRQAGRFGVSLKTGVPIGAFTSRLVANLALKSLDDEVESRSGVACYRRYVDDFVIVAKIRPSEAPEGILEKFVPVYEEDDDLVLRSSWQGQQSDGLRIQKKKLKIHVLDGIAGQQFLEAVADDYQRVISEGRSFLDPEVLSPNGSRSLIRVIGQDGSPLRALRDFDRARLERYTLSVGFRSLERISSMLDEGAARRIIVQNIENLSRIAYSDQAGPRFRSKPGQHSGACRAAVRRWVESGRDGAGRQRSLRLTAERLRIESPFRASLYALWTSRSRMASATVRSPR